MAVPTIDMPKKKVRAKRGELEVFAKAKEMAYLDAVRVEIERRGISRYRIWKDTKISQSALARFWKPEGTIGTASLCVLLDYLGIRFVGQDGKALPVHPKDV